MIRKEKRQTFMFEVHFLFCFVLRKKGRKTEEKVTNGGRSGGVSGKAFDCR